MVYPTRGCAPSHAPITAMIEREKISKNNQIEYESRFDKEKTTLVILSLFFRFFPQYRTQKETYILDIFKCSWYIRFKSALSNIYI